MNIAMPVGLFPLLRALNPSALNRPTLEIRNPKLDPSAKAGPAGADDPRPALEWVSGAEVIHPPKTLNPKPLKPKP